VRPKAASSLPIASPDLPTRTLPKHPAPLVSARQARGTWRVASPRCLRARAPYRPRLPSNSIRPRPISAHSRFRHAEVTQQLTSARDHAEARVLEAFAEAERRVEEVRCDATSITPNSPSSTSACPCRTVCTVCLHASRPRALLQHPSSPRRPAPPLNSARLRQWAPRPST